MSATSWTLKLSLLALVKADVSSSSDAREHDSIAGEHCT
jgi:hypothetical protein